MDELNLGDFCRHWARWRPDAVALWFDERAVTWRGLGDRVAVLMGNRIEWVEVTVALLKLGALTVPLNTRYSATEIAFVVGNADCVMAVTEEAMAAGMSV